MYKQVSRLLTKIAHIVSLFNIDKIIVQGGRIMTDKKIKDVDTARLEVLRRMPKEIVDKLTQEEIKIFLYQDDWPDSLREKLKDYLID